MSSDKDLQDRLAKVSQKQAVWRATSYEKKLALLNQHIKVLGSPECFDALLKVSNATTDMQGVKAPGLDRQAICTLEQSSNMMALKGYLEALRDSYTYKVTGRHPYQSKLDSYLKKTKVIKGQVVTPIFPLYNNDHFGLISDATGEIWFDPAHVKRPEQVKPFAFDELDDKMEKGALVVLGAGNQSMICAVDSLHALYLRNRVVFLKHHPLRTGMEPFLRFLLKPLFDQGFIDSELHVSLERTSAMIYSPYTSGVHLTGGKPTHDAIVFGSPNGPKTTKKLKSEMSSELGCITPWIVTPTVYTKRELTHQAEMAYTGAWFCASANCNAVKVVVLSSEWDQRYEFREHIISSWQKHTSPCAYYPGAKDRWEKFEKAYPDSSFRFSGQSPSTESESCRLPLLVVDIPVDIDTDAGLKKAKEEYAFRNEAFAPVLIFATINSKSPKDFMKKAVTFCNDCLYGRLSMSMSVPKSAKGSAMVEEAVADLKYGTVAQNVFSAATFLSPALSWGAYPGEKIEAVESGIGKVYNALLLDHVAKCVVRASSYHPMHVVATESVQTMVAMQTAAARMAHKRNPFTIYNFLSVKFGLPSMTSLVAVSALVAGAAILMKDRLPALKI